MYKWYLYGILFIVIATFVTVVALVSAYSGTNENNDNIQKSLGIIAPVLIFIFLALYGLLYVWLQAEPDIMVPLFMGLNCMNSIIASIAVSTSILVKQ